MSERLTDRMIAAFRHPGGANSVALYDSEVVGLAVRIYASGVKSFTFDWTEHGKARRVTIGRAPAWTIGKARGHATKLRLRADVGESVVSSRGSRVIELTEKWKEVVRLTKRPSTAKSYCRLIDSHVVPAFGKGEPRAITRNVVERWHAEIAQKTPTEANRALAILSAFLTWCEHDRLIDRNPAKGIKRRSENHREVYLDGDEITAALRALDAEASAPALALKLALLSGARIGEVIGITTEQIDPKREVWVKPAASTKQAKLHIAPLSTDALAVARALLKKGAPTYDQCRVVWDRVRKVIGRGDIRIHDLRHSRASALARNGASLLQIGKLLGHTATATTARYAHLVSTDLRDLNERT
jgi:integrase